MGKTEERKTSGCMKVFLFGAMIFVAAMIWTAIKGPQPPSASTFRPLPPSAPSSAPESSPTPPTTLGAEVVLSNPGVDYVFLATTDDAWDPMMKALMAGDKVGIAEMMAEGKVVAVPAGTRAKLINIAVTCRKVRITRGDKAGIAGWVEMESVKAPETRTTKTKGR